MKKIDLTIIVSAFAAILFSTSCSKSLEGSFNKQEENIEAIVASLTKSQSPDTLTYRNGSVRVMLVQGSGEPLSKNGKVSFWYEAYRITGETLNANDLLATNSKELAESVGFPISDSTILAVKTLDLSGDGVVEGLRNGLVGVRSGEECVVLFSGRHGFRKRAGTLPANSALAYHLLIESVSN